MIKIIFIILLKCVIIIDSNINYVVCIKNRMTIINSRTVAMFSNNVSLSCSLSRALQYLLAKCHSFNCERKRIKKEGKTVAISARRYDGSFFEFLSAARDNASGNFLHGRAISGGIFHYAGVRRLNRFCEIGAFTRFIARFSVTRARMSIGRTSRREHNLLNRVNRLVTR